MAAIPRVSIGLPVYNGENYLEESLVSILAQSYEDFELIISDNASTDATADICRSYASRDRRIQYFRQERNIGGASNFNFTVQVARANLFKWVSHDDVHFPTFVERCIEVLDKEPDVVLACPRYRLIDERGNEIVIQTERGKRFWVDQSGRVSPIRPYDPPRQLGAPRPFTRFRDLLLETNWDIEIYGVIRTEALRRTRLHGSYHGTDKRILAELCLMGPFAEIPEVLFSYRQHPVQQQIYKSSTAVRDRYMGGGGLASLFPRIHNLRGFAGAVRSADLSVDQRLLCYLALNEWFFRPGRWPALALETWHNVRDLVFSNSGSRKTAGVS